MNDLERKIFECALPICTRANVELVSVKIIKQGALIVRVIIDRPGGVGIDDTTRVSEGLNLVLDEIDPFAGQYYLEVSSRGVERDLTSLAEITASIGKHVAIKTNMVYKKSKNQEILGTLVAADGETVVILAKDKQVIIPYNSITKIRLAVKF